MTKTKLRVSSMDSTFSAAANARKIRKIIVQ